MTVTQEQKTTNRIDHAAEADAEFVAAAREAVPTLIEKLRVAEQHQREASLTIRSVEGLRKERDDLLAAVDAVQKLHKKGDFPYLKDDWCAECDDALYPCPTIRALDEHLAKEAD